MKSLICLFLFFYCAIATAQFKIKEIKLADDNEGYDVAYPILYSELHPDIAKKINTFLLKSELDLNVGPATKDSLANITRFNSYGYSVIGNNERVLSLEITTFYTGAGSHYSNKSLLFDARTGEAINEETLFDPSAKTKLKQVACKAWKESIKANLKDASFGAQYKTCLVDAEKTTEVEIERMAVADKTIIFWGGYCLDPEQSSNDKTNGPHPIPFEQLLSMMTPYCLSLFIGYPSSSGALPLALLKGQIDGKYNITLTFTQSDPSGALKGVIVYDRVNSPIPISGTIKDNKVLFHELDATNAPISDIECTWNGKDLIGMFKNLKNNKPMTFTATRK